MAMDTAITLITIIAFISNMVMDTAITITTIIIAFIGTMVMDTAITIRTLVVKDGVAYVQAGGGIVYDSKPAMEFEETEHKASAVLRAIERAESGG